MANANDWQDIGTEMRDAMAELAEAAEKVEELARYYTKNAFSTGDYLNGLADGDQIGTTGRTKAEVVAFVTFGGDLTSFLDSGVVGQADRRATVDQFRATS